jgi:hypothetical protein
VSSLLSQQEEKEKKIALEVIQFFKSNNLRVFEVESILETINQIVKKETYL